MRKMFLLLSMLIAASFFVTSCEQPAANNAAANKPANANTNTAASTASSEADVKKVLTDLQTALGKNDTAALDKIYVDDYTFVSPEGEIQTKAQRMESMKSGELKMESITFADPKVRVYGDTAVVTAKTTVKSTLKGKDTSGTSTATIVLTKTKDGWRVVHGHPSVAMPAAKTADTNTAGANANKAAAPANK